MFLLGMRINRLWKVHKWMPIAAAMPKMLMELSRKPESGFLGYQSYGGIPPVTIMCWKSFEQLEAYAKDRNGQHYPAWRDFNKKIRNSGDVGIWHETYKVKAGEYECVYNNMPRFGLGKIGELVPAIGRKEYAGQRIAPKDNLNK
ncbi:MAG TPA: DUF4188 domain-containing protein [Pedobacter sp.]